MESMPKKVSQVIKNRGSHSSLPNTKLPEAGVKTYNSNKIIITEKKLFLFDSINLDGTVAYIKKFRDLVPVFSFAVKNF